MTDITKTVAPKTDQLNADDFFSEPTKTILITGARMMDSKEQPIAISYEGDNGKPWKPSLGMRRVLLEIWGQEAGKAADKHYPGRLIRLFRDPDVKFGKDTVGGIRISHASHISGEKKIPVTVSKARRVEWIVRPLKAPETAKEAATITNPITPEELSLIETDINEAANAEDMATIGEKISAMGPRMTEEQKVDLRAKYKAKNSALKGAME